MHIYFLSYNLLNYIYIAADSRTGSLSFRIEKLWTYTLKLQMNDFKLATLFQLMQTIINKLN